MQVWLAGGEPRVTEQLLQLVDRGAGGDHAGGHRMPQHVRVDRPGQPRSARQLDEQLVERLRPHRRADRFSEQVDHHEVAARHGRSRVGVTLQRVGVVGLDQQPVGGYRPATPGLGRGAVGVGAADHVQVRTGDPTAEPGGVGDQVDVLAAQAAQLPAAQARPPHAGDDETVAGVAAGPHQPQHFLVAGRLDLPLGLVQAVAGLDPQPRRAFAADLERQVPVLDDLKQRVQRGLVDRADGGGVLEELPHRGQHLVHPPRPPHRLGADHPIGGLRVVVPEPEHEPAKVRAGGAPAQPGPGAPLQEQGDRPGVGLGGALGAVPPQPQMQQEVIGLRYRPVALVDHRPVALPGRQPHHERAELRHVPSSSRASHRDRPILAGRCDRHGTGMREIDVRDMHDTPTGHVDHGPGPRAVQQSPTAWLPGENDLFHARVPTAFIAEVFAVMESTPQHTYQVLTKRPKRARQFLRGWKPAPNIWLGVSVEDDSVVDRANILREVPAAVRFLSCEPLLGPLPSLDLTAIHWVIVGGESGPDFRPMRAEWATDLRDRCIAGGVPFFFKQWGGRTPKSGGRLLEDRTWDQMPPVASVGAGP
jgi:protein gp37